MIRILFFLFLLTSSFSFAKESSNTAYSPTKITEDGEYIYEPESSKEAIYYQVDDLPPIRGAFFLRFGTVGPYDIEGDAGATYEQLYTDRTSFVVVGEYERYLGHLLGKWTLKLGSGLSVEEGRGRFLSTTTSAPDESFLFFVFPNTALLNYKLKFSDTQIITPYIEGGVGYFTFLEARDDGNRFSFGGAGVLAFSGGFLVSLNILDKNAAGIMFEDYGVNHLWFDLQFRRNQGLDKQKDFSSDMITAGFGFAF